MKIDPNEPYSVERAVAINTAIHMRWTPQGVDRVLTLNGVPYHTASEDLQRVYWRNFLLMAKDRLDENE